MPGMVGILAQPGYDATNVGGRRIGSAEIVCGGLLYWCTELKRWVLLRVRRCY